MTDEAVRFTASYLAYLRDCAAMAARDLPHDLLARSTRCELRCLQSADLRELAMTGTFLTDDETVARWHRKSLISAENECAFCVGYWITCGNIGHDKISAPLLVADADLSAEGSTKFRFTIREGTLRPYAPAVALLLSRNADVETAAIANAMSEVDAELPARIDRPASLNRFAAALSSRLPSDAKSALAGLPAELGACDVAVMDSRRGEVGLATVPTAVALMFDSPPGFSVERELTSIASHDQIGETGVVLLARDVGSVRHNHGESSPRESEPARTAEVLEVLTLSEQQRESVLCSSSRRLTVISGPPGTGKSHTISALAINSAQAGRTVLLTSKTREAVSVVVDKLKELGGDYAVAHVGDRDEQRRFAGLLKDILQYQRLDLRKTNAESAAAREDLRRARAHEADTAAAIHRLERYHAQFHRSRSEIARLAHLSPPPTPLNLDELQVLRANAGWTRTALARPLLTMAQRLRTRALLGGIRSRLQLGSTRTASDVVDTADLAFHREVSNRAASSLRGQRSIRELWSIHDESVRRVQECSRKFFAASRRLQIAEALHADHDNTARLRRYAQALELRGTGGTERKKAALLEGVDPTLLLQCFPVWAGTSAHLAHALPLTPCLFDTVIVDEASLCDPATAMPALFRASSVVVVGDEKQLKHRTQLSSVKMSLAAQRAGLTETQAQELGYPRSLFEIALSRAPKAAHFLLDEHYRSLPPIIRFSNQEYYDGHLKIMRRTPASDHARVIEFRHVGGRRNEMDVIPEEFDEALAIVNDLLAEDPARSAGVITMTEAQASYMNTRFSEVLTLDAIRRLRFKCGSPQSFQGDQRHTIVLCPGIAADAHPRSVQHAMDPNRFNVAVTRAEDRVFVVSAMEPGQYHFPLRGYHELATNGAAFVRRPVEDLFESGFERQVYSLLVSNGFIVEQQYESCGYRIDFVVHQNGRFVAVEADGPRHFDAAGNHVPGDIQRALRLMRGGWRIERISWLEWESGPEARERFIARVRTALNDE